MKKKTEMLNTIVLGVLVMLCVYQTGRLWFDDLSDRNFFYNVMGMSKNVSNVVKSEGINGIKPWRMFGFYPGENAEFKIIDSSRKDFYEIEKYIDSILTDALQSKNKLIVKELNWEELWKEKSIVYEYAAKVPSEIYTNGFNNILNIKEEFYFDKMFIVPATLINKMTKCYFVDEEKNKMYEIKVEIENANISSKLIKSLDNIKDTSISYSSTKENNLKKFSKNVFLPSQEQNLYKVKVEKPFLKDGLTDKVEVEEYVDNYFSNPYLKMYSMKEGKRYKYQDDKITVEYSVDGLLEYKVHKITGESKMLELEDAIKIALNFLKKDELLKENQYYLVDYKYEKDGIILYYDYKFDEFAYIQSSDMKETVGMKNGIEVFVQGDIVKNYKRVLFEMKHIGSQNLKIDDTSDMALDRFLKRTQGSLKKDKQVSNMFLVYYQESIKQNPTINWIIVYDGLYYIEPIVNKK